MSSVSRVAATRDKQNRNLLVKTLLHSGFTTQDTFNLAIKIDMISNQVNSPHNPTFKN